MQRRPSDPARPIDAVALGLLALVLRIPALLSERHLTFDDGVFASSALAMREGGVPFRDVFSSQGPLFLPLAWLGDLLGGRTLDSPRVLAVASGVVATVAAWWCARQFTDRVGAALAGGLAATSGSLMWVTGPLAADGPALAFCLLAVGTALSMRERRSPWRAVVLGALVGAALSTKSLEAPVLVPVGLVLVWPLWPATTAAGRAGVARTVAVRDAALGALGAVVVWFVVTVPFGFAEVWDQSVRYRSDAASSRDPLANAAKIISTLWDRDLVLLGFAVLAAGGAVLHRRARATSTEPDSDDAVPVDPGAPPSGALLATAWLVATLVWLVVVVSPLWRPHVSAVVPPLVLLVSAYRPPVRWIAVAAVVSVPLLWVQLDGLLRPGDYVGEEAEVVALLRELPDGAWVLSDEPGLAWRAGRRTTDDLVDPSMLRVQQGRYDEDSLADAAADPRVCAVVVRSDQRFGAFPGLPDRLAAEGFTEELRHEGAARVYLRADCAPAGS